MTNIKLHCVVHLLHHQRFEKSAALSAVTVFLAGSVCTVYTYRVDCRILCCVVIVQCSGFHSMDHQLFDKSAILSVYSGCSWLYSELYVQYTGLSARCVNLCMSIINVIEIKSCSFVSSSAF